jgi:hypothetical protein
MMMMMMMMMMMRLISPILIRACWLTMDAHYGCSLTMVLSYRYLASGALRGGRRLVVAAVLRLQLGEHAAQQHAPPHLWYAKTCLLLIMTLCLLRSSR